FGPGRAVVCVLNGLLAHIQPQSFDTSSFASMNRASSSALLTVSTSSFARMSLRCQCARLTLDSAVGDSGVSLSLPRSVGAFVGMQSPEIVQQYVNARWRKASPPQLSRIPLPRRFACVIILQ